MNEKVNPCHPDKVADRIAGAIVDLAYTKVENPKIAVEVLLGHGYCYVIAESSVELDFDDVNPIIHRIAKQIDHVRFLCLPQDGILAGNQKQEIRCGDNGIFKGSPLTKEQKYSSELAREIFSKYPTDGKYIVDGKKVVICQSHANSNELREQYPEAVVNPLGDWTGGSDVDAGATNRKLGSDMAGGVTGGGLHGKDLSKADVSVNIWCFLEAQRTGREVNASCAIGDRSVNGVPYRDIIEVARRFINDIGGFEKFAEWGLY